MAVGATKVNGALVQCTKHLSKNDFFDIHRLLQDHPRDPGTERPPCFPQVKEHGTWISTNCFTTTKSRSCARQDNARAIRAPHAWSITIVDGSGTISSRPERPRVQPRPGQAGESERSPHARLRRRPHPRLFHRLPGLADPIPIAGASPPATLSARTRARRCQTGIGTGEEAIVTHSLNLSHLLGAAICCAITARRCARAAVTQRTFATRSPASAMLK